MCVCMYSCGFAIMENCRVFGKGMKKIDDRWSTED